MLALNPLFAAFTLADSAGKWPYAEEVTSDFVYIRLHGAEKLYNSGYTDARRITDRRILKKQKDAFVFFDNDAKVHAPFNAISLAERFGIPEKRAKRLGFFHE